MTELLDIALWLAEGGFAIFPCHGLVDGRCTCGGECGRDTAKHPRTRDGFKSATRDRDQITRWWTSWSSANIGMATGTVSRTVVLDVDVHDANGFDTLHELGHELPKTVTSITGGGGQHVYFRHPGGIPSATEKLGAGLDIRGEGGYIILPPSIHKSGRRYEWDNAPGEVPWAARETEGLVQMGFALSLAAWCLETATRRGQRLCTRAR